jgi:hypothetical protein
MNIAPKGMIPFTALACMGMVGFAGPRWSDAQTPSPAPAPDTSTSHASAQSDAGDPRAVTSPDAAAEQDPGASGAATSADASRMERRSQTPKAAGKADGKADGKSDAAGKAATAGRADATGKGTGKSPAVDKLELQTATVTGDREQPKVMYIVPWKRSDIGDLSGKPMNSLLDEALAPVDRDEFKREVMYYQAVRKDASQNGAGAVGGAAPPAPPR